MTQHPSLSSGREKKRHRSVLKRYERLKHMKEKDKWDEEKSSIFGLPKIKMLRFRVKKEKAVEEVPAEGVAAGAESETGAEVTPKAQEGKEKKEASIKGKGAPTKEKEKK